MKRVLSGITPSGNELHIGNYFGAVKPQIELQNSGYETYYFVADLHALTTIKDRDQLTDNINSIVINYLSLGLDPEKTVFFRQSDVPAHSQLAVVLNNFVTYGHMKRMHAFKDKLQKGTDEESINMGLFNYPILMAADILLYQPDFVPVGEDQRQHVEICRDIGDSFNKTYGQTVFKLPEPMINPKVGKIIGTDGQRKMSKSLNNIISIFGDEAKIKQQIMGCYTDPNRLRATDPGKVEGNPVFIYHDLINPNQDEVADLKIRYKKGQVGDVEVKQKLFQAHLNYFKEIRAKKDYYLANQDLVRQILTTGKTKASVLATSTLESVYQTIGI